MFSVLASGEALFDLVASAIWPNVYNITINHKLSPGTSFVIMAVVAFTGVPFVM
jgi:cytochrome bd-type quinol oxidase subunit 2